MATSAAIQQEALTRAVSGQSLSNYAPIIRGFMAKGIPENQIIPRVNVFSYNAWKANGRQVRKGEHGVKCLTFITKTAKNGREERRPWTVTVFHVSQTEPVGADTGRERTRTYSYPPSNISGREIIPVPDATPENIPYAGEEDTDESELLDHSTAVHVNREIQKFSPDATVETFDVEETAPNTFRIESPFSAVPVSTPKDSAAVRAMRGEQVSIMDIIAELPKREPKRETLAQHDRRIDRQYNAARRNVQQMYRDAAVKTAKQDVVF